MLRDIKRQLLIRYFTFTVLLLGFSTGLYAQDTGNITVIVQTENGETLPGASVILASTKKSFTRSAVSDAKGMIAFQTVPADSSYCVTVSFVGLKSQVQCGYILKRGQKVTVVVKMNDASSKQMDEVVVVGYGTQRKENLTGSVGVIRDSQIAGRPVTQMSQALTGLTPGLYINANTGEPGNDQANIRIRGTGTLNDANPLILIDGIEGPLDNINPSDISSISILKDASSAAIYGSRAANGVILVTTKRGKLDQKTGISYNLYSGISTPTVLPEMVTDNRTYLQLYREAMKNTGGSVSYTDADIERYANLPSTDWMDVIFRDAAPITQHAVSVNGGGPKVSYLFSSAYLNQAGLLDGDQRYKRFNSRLNMDMKLNEKLNGGVSFSYSRANSSLASQQNVEELTGKGSLAFEGGLTQHPLTPVFDALGRYAGPEAKLGLRNDRASGRAILDHQNTGALGNDLLGNAFLSYEPFKDFKIRGTLAFNSQTRHTEDINSEFKQYDWMTGTQLSVANPGSNMTDVQYSLFNVTSWLQATYEKSFGKHFLKGLAGFNQETSQQQRNRLSQEQFATPSQIIFGKGATTTAISGTKGEWALQSYFARANYAYDGKYLFEANIRRDGSSRFGKNNRWATFPSFSAGWVASNEDFWNKDLISLFKLRASWGKLGNQNTSLYPFASQMSLGNNYVFASGQVSGAALSTLGNPDLKWETTTTTDVGMEMSFFKGKLSLEADYFVKRTDDILTQLSNPLVTGIVSPTIVNAASVENKGWEGMFNYKDRIGAVTLGIGANVTYIKNKVLAINPALAGKDDRVELSAINNIYLIRGESINAMYGYITEGIFQSADEIKNAADHTLFGAAKPGDFKIQDTNSDGKITEADRVVMGNRQPKWLYGFNLSAGYKGFDIAALFQGIGKADAFISRLNGPFPRAGLRKIWEERWTPENPSTTMPSLWSDRSGYNGKTVESLPSSFWVQHRDYLRLKNIQLGYTFDKAKLKRLPVQSIRLYANAQNLWTKTKFKDFDPERLDTEAYVTTSLPQAKVITAGINVIF
ncbi:TonB-dependent receptor [Pedobacter sp. MC2016-14]|uniref:SusC/RagA family TonB-linked outer membrane protein n=1 Tax=Pedobacter sp. MC2016-14 TaxID=2897327 RepID=UPI001E55D5FA|nr:TonB-dependent receptor [Pedobacter sp. MC2016-14]MCD0488330.1 TonB-dependent receptor [Pedobacter sp. MC2016-14]